MTERKFNQVAGDRGIKFSKLHEGDFFCTTYRTDEIFMVIEPTTIEKEGKPVEVNAICIEMTGEDDDFMWEPYYGHHFTFRDDCIVFKLNIVAEYSIA